MALTDTQIRKVKTREKPFKLTDEKGLFLLINPNGSKLWWCPLVFIQTSLEHEAKILHRLERDIFPWLGYRRIIEITAPELLLGILQETKLYVKTTFMKAVLWIVNLVLMILIIFFVNLLVLQP